VDPVAEVVIGFFVPAADNSGGVGDKQGSELGLGVASEIVAGEDSGGGVSSTACRYAGA